MSSLNTGKVIAGGLAAGLVVNVVESVVNLAIIGESMDEMLAGMNLDPLGGAAIGGFVFLGFAVGLLISWTYAAIRPRFGPGPGTAVKAGLAVWLAFYGLGGLGNWLMGFAPTNLFLIALCYTLFMMVAAGYVAGLVYREEGAVA